MLRRRVAWRSGCIILDGKFLCHFVRLYLGVGVANVFVLVGNSSLSPNEAVMSTERARDRRIWFRRGRMLGRENKTDRS